MGNYRYVGSGEAQILDTPYKFTKYGQLVEMDDDLAYHAIVNGRHSLIPNDAFEQLGHTKEELQFFSRLDTHALTGDNLPEHLQNFHSRKEAAWGIAQALRDQLMRKNNG